MPEDAGVILCRKWAPELWNKLFQRNLSQLLVLQQWKLYKTVYIRLTKQYFHIFLTPILRW